MKVEVSRKSLIAVLARVIKAVLDEKAIIKSSKYFHLEASPGKMTVSGCNLRFQIRQSMTASVSEPGSVLVPAYSFLELLYSLTGDQLVLRATPKNWVSYKCAPGKGRVKGMAASEFPKMPQHEGDSTPVEASELIRLIKQTVFATATEDQKGAVLMSVLADLSGEQFRFVATDTQRLATREVKVKNGGQLSGIIPDDSLKTLLRVIPSSDKDKQTVNIAMSKAAAFFKVDGVEFTTLLTEGQYPEYGGIIPDGWVSRIVVDTDKFKQAMRSARIFSRAVGLYVRLSFFPPPADSEDDKGVIKVFGRDTQAGDVTTMVDATMEGQFDEGMQDVKVSAKLLLDCLKVVDTDKIAIEMNGSKAALVLRAVGDDNYLYVVSQMGV